MSPITQPILHRFTQFKPQQQLRGNAGPAATTLFDQKLRHERLRSNRTNRPFALLVFSLRDDAASRDELTRLRERLTVQLRETDAIGWIDRSRLGVLLPETGESQAREFLSRMTTMSELHDDGVMCEVLTYPEPSSFTAKQDADKEIPQDCVIATISSDLVVQPLPRWKRALDLVGASMGLIVTSPLLLVAMALIKLTSPGPALFTQQRRGLGGRPFTIYKLRTMCVGADSQKGKLRCRSEQDGPAFKLAHDPRVTPVGRYLRKTCIDELPQLWNVLRGDMTLVGPRPLPIDEADRCLTWQQRRLDVTPGLTCIWQVSGGMRVPFLEWMRMDLRYIRHRSLWLDLKLICRTAWAVVRHRASH